MPKSARIVDARCKVTIDEYDVLMSTVDNPEIPFSWVVHRVLQREVERIKRSNELATFADEMQIDLNKEYIREKNERQSVLP